MSKLVKIILNRRSVREFTPKPISDCDLKKILECGRNAPSWHNTQPWHFLVVRDREKLMKIGGVGEWNSYIQDCGAAVFGLGDEKNYPDTYLIDVSIALENMCLAAESLGIKTCWTGSMDMRLVRKLCNIPDDLAFVCCLVLGYPFKKKTLNEVVHHEEFSEVKQEC
jgi:nitroreductase